MLLGKPLGDYKKELQKELQNSNSNSMTGMANWGWCGRVGAGRASCDGSGPEGALVAMPSAGVRKWQVGGQTGAGPMPARKGR
jgi:hypothetical protein